MTLTSRDQHDDWDIATSVGSTAVMVAACRAVETAGPDPKISDPYAAVLVSGANSGAWEHLLDADMPARLAAASAETVALYTNMLGYQATRTHFFDTCLTAAAQAGITQVVILASGLDSRAYRLDWPAGTIIYEIDQPKVLAYKATALAAHGATPTAERREVGADLRGDWPAALRAAGFDPAISTVWLAEGLLVYLNAEARELLFDRITELSAPGSRFATEGGAPRRDGVPVWIRFVRAAAELGIEQSVVIEDLVHPVRPTPVELLAERRWRVTEHPVRQAMQALDRWVEVPGAEDEARQAVFVTGGLAD